MAERRSDDATLISALRILARDIQTGDGVAFACLAEAATRLEELVEERRWVPVGERLPEDEEWVEMAGTWGEDIGYFDGEQWLNTESETFDYLVTHWRKRTPGPEWQ
jgi:hypothetical protein